MTNSQIKRWMRRNAAQYSHDEISTTQSLCQEEIAIPATSEALREATQ